MIEKELQLIKAAQRGDVKAFEQLIVMYDRQVLNIAHSFRNNEDDAKDIYQEVFIRVFNGLKNFQFRSEFSTWLFRITTNVCLTHKTKKERVSYESLDKTVSSDEESSTTFGDMLPGFDKTDSSAENSDLTRYINQGLDRLPPKQKLVFTLKHFQGYKIKEIAQMMNCNDGTIKRYLFNATGKMREYLNKFVEL
ncbi:MAG: RNA polymerase sigma factor [Rhodothermaceae bacterium]